MVMQYNILYNFTFHLKSIFMKSLFLLFTFLLTGQIAADNSGNGIKNVCKYSLDESPKVRIDDHLQGIWKLKEDTDFHNYFILEKVDDYRYCLTYMNRSGDNRGLEHGLAFFLKSIMLSS